MGTNPCHIIPARRKIGASGSDGDGRHDVGGTDMEIGLHGAEGCVRWQSLPIAQGRHSAGRGFYRTERPRDGFVVEGLAALAVLLVVDSEGHRGSRQ